MNRKIFFALLAALMVATLPGIAMAAQPAPITLTVRNQTGADASVQLTGPDGAPQFLELPAGVYKMEMTEGVYSFYANTQCGSMAGVWNVDKSKTLYLNCKEGPYAELRRYEVPDYDICYSLLYPRDFIEIWDKTNWSPTSWDSWDEVYAFFTGPDYDYWGAVSPFEKVQCRHIGHYNVWFTDFNSLPY